ncbi:MAG: hypothetical protein U5O15_06345 [Candidatus Krumholzibacteriota bacterium]|nr:hypothetical protein [Candidatus Krumholzibacteriota bacterium]
MFKRIVSIMIIVSFITMVQSSCSRENSVRPDKKEETQPDDNLEKVLKNDPAVNEFVQISEQLIIKAMDNKVSAAELEIAYENEDDEFFGHLLGYEETEIRKISDRILDLSNTISKRYPKIKKQAEKNQNQKCKSCDFNKVIENWDGIVSKYNNQHRRIVAVDPAICKVVQLTVGMYLCAATLASVVLYVLCAYMVVCASCSGGWADDICM